MRRILISVIIFTLLIMAMSIPTIYADNGLSDDGFSRYLVEYDTGEVITAQNENARHQIASMVKIMSLNIIFDEIDSGTLSLDDKVLISNNAANTGGSELLIDAGVEYTVSDLVKGIIVVSANDATIALAEKIANNEDNFVKIMNDKAKEWGMTNTLFLNATGLPKAGQYSSAKDVTIMMRHLMAHKEYFNYSKIWTEDFRHPSGRITNLTNTNKLVRFYDGCDAGKTGFTNDAGFCLTASAKRNSMRVIGSVIGANTSKNRFKAMSNMFNDAFNNYSYKVIKSKDELIPNDIKIRRARGKKLDVVLSDDVKILYSKDNKKQVNLEYDMPSDVKAPIKKGDIVGKCNVYINGEFAYSIDLVSATDIAKSSIFDDFININ